MNSSGLWGPCLASLARPVISIYNYVHAIHIFVVPTYSGASYNSRFLNSIQLLAPWRYGTLTMSSLSLSISRDLASLWVLFEPRNNNAIKKTRIMILPISSILHSFRSPHNVTVLPYVSYHHSFFWHWCKQRIHLHNLKSINVDIVLFACHWN